VTPLPGPVNRPDDGGRASRAVLRPGLASETLAEAKPEPVDLADLDFDLGSRDAQPSEAGDGYLETTLAFPNTAQGDALDFDLATSLPEAVAPTARFGHGWCATGGGRQFSRGNDAGGAGDAEQFLAG
jgi:hypothetical protein